MAQSLAQSLAQPRHDLWHDLGTTLISPSLTFCTITRALFGLHIHHQHITSSKTSTNTGTFAWTLVNFWSGRSPSPLSSPLLGLYHIGNGGTTGDGEAWLTSTDSTSDRTMVRPTDFWFVTLRRLYLQAWDPLPLPLLPPSPPPLCL